MEIRDKERTPPHSAGWGRGDQSQRGVGWGELLSTGTGDGVSRSALAHHFQRKELGPPLPGPRKPRAEMRASPQTQLQTRDRGKARAAP